MAWNRMSRRFKSSFRGRKSKKRKSRKMSSWKFLKKYVWFFVPLALLVFLWKPIKSMFSKN